MGYSCVPDVLSLCRLRERASFSKTHGTMTSHQPAPRIVKPASCHQVAPASYASRKAGTVAPTAAVNHNSVFRENWGRRMCQSSLWLHLPQLIRVVGRPWAAGTPLRAIRKPDCRFWKEVTNPQDKRAINRTGLEARHETVRWLARNYHDWFVPQHSSNPRQLYGCRVTANHLHGPNAVFVSTNDAAPLFDQNRIG